MKSPEQVKALASARIAEGTHHELVATSARYRAVLAQVREHAPLEEAS